MKLFSLAALLAAPLMAAAADAADPATPVPAAGYRSVFDGIPQGVEEETVDWKKANAEVAQFPRGHIDLLKWEEANPGAAPQPQAAPTDAPSRRPSPPAPAPRARAPALKEAAMRLLLLSCALALAGCATTQSPEALRADVDRLAEGRTGVAPAETGATLQSLLAKQPLDADSAVRIALLNSPGLDATLAALAISDAERVAAAQLPNPHFAFARLREGQVLEIERMISFNVLSLVTLPWRAQYANQSLQLARLRAAQEVIRTAADTRKAWFNAVAAQQTAAYMRDAREAAEAGAELARRMARVGNWSKLQQAREQAVLADISAQLARAQQAALSEREKLTRLMGLWGQDATSVLPERLPDLPEQLAE